MIQQLKVLLLTAVASNAQDLLVHEEMRLSHLFEQGFYPSIASHNAVMISSPSLKVSFGERGSGIELGQCIARFTFSPTGELLHGDFIEDSGLDLAERLQKIDELKSEYGCEVKYSTDSYPFAATPNGDWDEVNFSFLNTSQSWEISFLGNRSENEKLQTVIWFAKLPTEKVIRNGPREWGGEIISSPEEWSHLPLKNGSRGYDPRITAFTYLVSSYDENGQLLPEFAERKKAIEAELVAQAPPPVSPPARKTTDSTEEVREAVENMDFWPWFVGGGLVALGLLRWIVVRRKV